MRALLAVTQADGGTPGTPCLPLLPVLDRPFLQHVIEALAHRGVTRIGMIVGPRAAELEEAIGDGRRWGCRLTWHMTRDPARPGRALAVAAAGVGRVLFGRTHCLPDLPVPLADLPPGRIEFDGVWTGWSVVDTERVCRTRLSGVHVGTLLPLVFPDGDRRHQVRRVLWLRSLADLPATQRAALGWDRGSLRRAGREVSPGVWVGRNAAVAATATLVPPVYIGEGVVVGRGANVGPHAVAGADCLLDNGCEIRNATVLPASYVGVGVRLDGVIADGRAVAHPVRGATVRVDAHLLDGLRPVRPVGLALGLLTRLAAGVAFVLALPLLALAAGWLRVRRRGRVFWPRSFAVDYGVAAEGGGRSTVYVLAPPLPRAANGGWVIPATRSGLLLEFLPALLAVARGRLRLVGVPPRTAAGLDQLAADHRPVLATAAMGLVTEAALVGTPDDSPEDALVTDTYQACTATFSADLRRLVQFLTRALGLAAGASRSGAGPADPVPDRGDLAYPRHVEPGRR